MKEVTPKEFLTTMSMFVHYSAKAGEFLFNRSANEREKIRQYEQAIPRQTGRDRKNSKYMLNKLKASIAIEDRLIDRLETITEFFESEFINAKCDTNDAMASVFQEVIERTGDFAEMMLQIGVGSDWRPSILLHAENGRNIIDNKQYDLIIMDNKRNLKTI